MPGSSPVTIPRRQLFFHCHRRHNHNQFTFRCLLLLFDMFLFFFLSLFFRFPSFHFVTLYYVQFYVFGILWWLLCCFWYFVVPWQILKSKLWMPGSNMRWSLRIEKLYCSCWRCLFAATDFVKRTAVGNELWQRHRQQKNRGRSSPMAIWRRKNSYLHLLITIIAFIFRKRRKASVLYIW